MIRIIRKDFIEVEQINTRMCSVSVYLLDIHVYMQVYIF